MPGNSPEEDLKTLYTAIIPDEMRTLVVSLNRLLGNDPGHKIKDAVAEHIGFAEEDVSDLEHYRQIRESNPATQNEVWEVKLPKDRLMTVEEMLSIAMLGILRIYHVHSNKDITPENESVGEELIAFVRAQIEKLKPAELPQYTIDGNSINWPGEIAQDTAKTFANMGRPAAARDELVTELERMNAKGELTAGEKSTYAVILYRMGILNNNLADMVAGLKKEKEVATEQLNYKRLMYLLKKVGLAAIDPRVEGSLKMRIEALRTVGESLLTAF